MTSKGWVFPHRWASDKALAIDGLRPGLAWLFLEMERQRSRKDRGNSSLFSNGSESVNRGNPPCQASALQGIRRVIGFS